ncbi:MAG: VIT1/CCC1 transporter family protein [Pirellulaceae bacterium]
MQLDPQQLADSHSYEQVRDRLEQENRPDYLSDFVYGAIDGTVTTFAVVSGVAGADLSSSIVIILGFANLIGDGFSMAASNFLGTRTDMQLHEKIRNREAAEIEAYPEGEREEVRQIYAAKGFSGELLESVVSTITADKQRWIDTMMTEEMGLSLTRRSPLRAASATMIAFLFVGLIPLLPFIVELVSAESILRPYVVSSVMAAAAFFFVGAIKSRFVQQRWYWSGLETLLVGGSAAVLAYGVGMALGNLSA